VRFRREDPGILLDERAWCGRYRPADVIGLALRPRLVQGCHSGMDEGHIRHWLSAKQHASEQKNGSGCILSACQATNLRHLVHDF
tara:strand:+ start:371 stop:625 length:255 start_codon:yes stop_codon:yes gene_type:complete